MQIYTKPSLSNIFMKVAAIHNNGVYVIVTVCFALSFLFLGMGSHIFGLPFFTDLSTFFIYVAFIVQLLTGYVRISRFIVWVALFIILQTFMLNIYYIDLASSLKHFIGLFLFGLVIFTFVSVFRYNLRAMLKAFFNFCFWVSFFSIFQTVVFVVFGISIIPQNIISGTLAYGTDSFMPEIFGVLPRIVGLSTEPANFTMLMMPSLYVSILTLIGSGNVLGDYSKRRALVVIAAFILSFSIVGYFGLMLCLVSIFRRKIKTNTIMTISMAIVFVAIVLVLMQSSIGSKIYSFASVSQDITGSEYTSNDQTSFALLSNMVVAGKALQISHYLGTGLNSHVITYNSTILSLFYESQIPNELNKENAGSLFIRITSEFGIPGILAYLFFMFRFFAGSNIKNSWAKTINHLSIVCLLSYSVRTGHYLNILFVFFVAVYIYSYKMAKEIHSIDLAD